MRSPRFPAGKPTGAHSSRTRSPAVPAPCCGRRSLSAGTRRGGVSNIAVEDLKTKLGVIADQIYGHPSRDLHVVGVTGTNGKTSCSHWIAQCFDACGWKSGIIGTLGSGILDTPGAGLGGVLDPSARTTPDAASVHETLARMKSQGARAVAMEVSSHGLDQGA
jgi:UDP-N-acetylmuramoyl-L-alanyl-D-glutamate--2,6-diaminopimelate ligase